MAEIYHKRGDTFTYYARWVQGDSDLPVNLTGLTIASQVRTDDFVGNLSVTVTNAVNGEFVISATADATSLWPITISPESSLFCDIQFTEGTTVVSTETIQIIVVRDITQ